MLKQTLIRTLRRAGLLDATRRISHVLRGARFMKYPTFGPDIQSRVLSSDDYVRHAAVSLAITSLNKNGIEGAMAEVGVYRGDASRLLHVLAPHRTLYLFDTFEGFPSQDLDRQDDRFRDTSVEAVRANIGDTHNVVFRKGYFPETALGLENESFAFVMLDADLYAPTYEGLKFFYPRMTTGGFIFLHDYNSPESHGAVSRAANEFLADKPEKLIELPDIWGSVVMRKV